MTNSQIAAEPEPSQQLFKEVTAFFNNGEFFRAYDLALDAFHLYPNEFAFAHRAVLSLANAGATDLALAKFAVLGLDRQRDVEIVSLLGRLKKDQGFAVSGETRRQLLDEARTIYETAYRHALETKYSESYYPGINAATLALLSGHADRATHLAKEVLSLLALRVELCRILGDEAIRRHCLSTL
jgi:tetratricopeptide (TPR) repeat protein